MAGSLAIQTPSFLSGAMCRMPKSGVRGSPSPFGNDLHAAAFELEKRVSLVIGHVNPALRVDRHVDRVV